MGRMRVGALAAALVVAIGVAACGGDDPPDVRSIALVSPGEGNDADWTRRSREAFEELAEQRRLAGLIAEGVTAAQARGAVEQLADAGADLVVANDSRYAREAVRAAASTGVPTLVWGARGAREPGLVGDVEIAAADAGFLVGALSGHSFDSIAVLIADDGSAWDARNWNLMAGGVIAGARHEAPGVRLTVEWVDGSDGPATTRDVKRASDHLLDRGFMTLVALGGRTTVAAFDEVSWRRQEQVFGGVIGDRAPIDVNSVVLTSVMYDFDGLFRRAVGDLRAGRFGERPYTLTFQNGGLRLLFTGRTSLDTVDSARAAQAALEAGDLDVPETPTRADVRALLDDGPQ